MNKTFKTYQFVRLAICSFLMLIKYTDSNAQGVFDHLYGTDIRKVRIVTDIDVIKANKRDVNKHAGTFSYTDEAGTDWNWDVNYTLRGRYRRMFSEGVPPLKIDFKKKQLEEAGLESYDDMKLVTLFHADKGKAFQTLTREYLTYKMFSEFTPFSYRVQLLEVTYVDKYTKLETKEYAFVIEDGKQLEDRMNMKELKETKNLDSAPFDDQFNEEISMFQYFVGNGDWKLLQPKNVNLFEHEGKIKAVPYDFDFSGMVNASYAVPDNSADRKTVKDRVYVGAMDDLVDLENVFAKFEVARPAFEKIINDCRFLSKSNRNEMLEYIASYYDDIDQRKEKNYSMQKSIRMIDEDEK